MASSKDPYLKVPNVFFDIVTILLPRLNYAAQKECSLSIGSLVVLQHIQSAGGEWDGRKAVLSRDLTTILRQRGFSKPGITRLLRSLKQQRAIERITLPLADRQALFPSSSGSNTLAIAITNIGETTLKDFRHALRRHFTNWLGRQDPSVRIWLGKIVLPTALKLAEPLVKQLASLGG